MGDSSEDRGPDRDRRLRRRLLTLSFGLFAVSFAAFIGLSGAELRSDVPEWYDVIGEGSVLVLGIGWVLAMLAVPPPTRVFWPVATGVLVLTMGETLDVIDEFVVPTNTAGIFENLGKVGGVALMSVGAAAWLQISQRRHHSLAESSAHFERLSVTDPLTGLYNRAYLFSRLTELLPRASMHVSDVSVVYMDLDDFKRFNDTYGHLAGDDVIKGLGEVLRQVSRDKDIPCRYGGEELVLVLPGADLDAARAVAERVRERFAALRFEPKQGVVESRTVSLGVATAAVGEDPKELLERADEAMYQAKRSGRDRVIASILDAA